MKNNWNKNPSYQQSNINQVNQSMLIVSMSGAISVIFEIRHYENDHNISNIRNIQRDPFQNNSISTLNPQ